MIDKYLPLYLITFVLSFSITVLCEKILIPILKTGAKQPIYAEGPKWHLSKSGTPTMGGLAFLIAVTLSLIVASLPLIGRAEKQNLISLYLCLGFSVLNAIIGVVDDASKLKKRENKDKKAKKHRGYDHNDLSHDAFRISVNVKSAKHSQNNGCKRSFV